MNGEIPARYRNLPKWRPDRLAELITRGSFGSKTVQRIPAALVAMAVAVVISSLTVVGCRQDDGSTADRGAATEMAQLAEALGGDPSNAEDAGELIAASHILIAYEGSRDAPPEVWRTRAEADDLARRILVLIRTDRAWFEDLARRYSEDPRTAERDGYLGTFRHGEMLPNFEHALLRLKPGQIGGPVETPYGFHVIRREPVRRIHAQHILVAWRGASKSGHEVKRSRERAREIAQEVQAKAVRYPEVFCDLALQLSDDPNNRAECGDLGWLEPGELAPEIESVLFRLRPGEVSEVVESPYGFHVFKRE